MAKQEGLGPVGSLSPGGARGLSLPFSDFPGDGWEFCCDDIDCRVEANIPHQVKCMLFNSVLK